MNTVKIRDIEIGAGAPKSIVPIVGITKEDIIEEAKTFDSIPVDVVESRVDWFEGVFDFAKVEDVLKDLRTVLGNIPLLMTFRTSKEGGEKAIEPDAYARTQHQSSDRICSLVDVEIFTGDEIVKRSSTELMQQVLRLSLPTMTSSKLLLKQTSSISLRKMQDMNADIQKIAVMPQNKGCPDSSGNGNGNKLC